MSWLISAQISQNEPWIRFKTLSLGLVTWLFYENCPGELRDRVFSFSFYIIAWRYNVNIDNSFGDVPKIR